MMQPAKKAAWELTGGAVLAMLVIVPWLLVSLISDISRGISRIAIDAADYMTVHGVEVMDSRQGEDPRVIYRRTVHKPFRGRWIASIYSERNAQGETYGVCNNSGEANYKPSIVLPQSGVSLEWFMEKDCQLEPGRYTLVTTWEILLDHGVIKRTTATSNQFEVKP